MPSGSREIEQGRKLRQQLREQPGPVGALMWLAEQLMGGETEITPEVLPLAGPMVTKFVQNGQIMKSAREHATTTARMLLEGAMEQAGLARDKAVQVAQEIAQRYPRVLGHVRDVMAKPMDPHTGAATLFSDHNPGFAKININPQATMGPEQIPNSVWHELVHVAQQLGLKNHGGMRSWVDHTRSNMRQLAETGDLYHHIKPTGQWNPYFDEPWEQRARAGAARRSPSPHAFLNDVQPEDVKQRLLDSMLQLRFQAQHDANKGGRELAMRFLREWGERMDNDTFLNTYTRLSQLFKDPYHRVEALRRLPELVKDLGPYLPHAEEALAAFDRVRSVPSAALPRPKTTRPKSVADRNK